MSALAAIVFVLLVVLWHVALWAIACVVIARTSGWQRLARAFPDRGAARAPRAGAMLMIGEAWAGSVRISAEADGLAIAPAPLLRIAHPALRIPWPDLALARSQHSPVTRAAHVTAGATELAFYGKGAQLVEDALAIRVAG